jgi:hypothetical protein
MARVGTTLLNLGTWLDGENPGAGSQSVDNTGLNGDKIKLDLAVGTEHNADGTHKADKIDGPSLKTTVADGSSLEATGTPRKLQVKALGIHKGHINTDVADADSLQKNGTSGALEIKAVKAGKILGTGTGKAVDGTTIGLNVSNELEVKDLGITGAKISRDNMRTKIFIAFSIDGSTKYGVIGGVVTTAVIGLPMPRAGAVTAISAVTSSGVVVRGVAVYSATAGNHFAIGARLTVADDSTGVTNVKLNGAIPEDCPVATGGETPVLVIVELELD